MLQAAREEEKGATRRPPRKARLRVYASCPPFDKASLPKRSEPLGSHAHRPQVVVWLSMHSIREKRLGSSALWK